MDSLSQGTLLEILRYIGSPLDFFVIPCVSRSWMNVLDMCNGELWLWIAAEYNVSMHSPHQKRSLRSTSNHKNVFMKAFIKRKDTLREQHESLLLQARLLFSDSRKDCPKRLSSLISTIFPNAADFDVNWTSSVVEANTLASMCSRGSNRPKCLKLLVEVHHANINQGDMGGFNPLILSAYHGNLACTVYCVRRGANLFAMGRERSGLYLIAEHWASIRGHWDVFQYLRSIRIKLQRKMFLFTQNKVIGYDREAEHSQHLIQSTDSLYGSHSRAPIVRNLFANNNNVTIIQPTIPVTAPTTGYHGEISGGSLSEFASRIPQTPIDTPHPDILCSSAPQEFISSSKSLEEEKIKMTTIEIIIPSNSTLLSAKDGHHQQQQPGELQAETYCVCSRGNIGNMVECDGPNCLIGWFHYTCAGLSEDLPEDSQWLCPSCTEGDGLRGFFPEPRPSSYSFFLNDQLPDLNFNSCILSKISKQR